MEVNASFKKRPREETTEDPQFSKEEISASEPESLTQDLAKQKFNKNNIVEKKIWNGPRKFHIAAFCLLKWNLAMNKFQLVYS